MRSKSTAIVLDDAQIQVSLTLYQMANYLIQDERSWNHKPEIAKKTFQLTHCMQPSYQV